MAKKFSKSEAEKKVERERVTRPISWRISEPRINSCGDLVVKVLFFVHNGSEERPGDKFDDEFVFNADDFSHVLRKVNQINVFYHIDQVKKIASIRDAIFEKVNSDLCGAYDESAQTERTKIFEEVVWTLQHTERDLMRCMVRAETLLNLLKRPKVFYSEELQSLFA